MSLNPRDPEFWRDWTVSEDDEKVGFLQLFVAFLTFGLVLIAIFGLVLMVWSAMP